MTFCLAGLMLFFAGCSPGAARSDRVELTLSTWGNAAEVKTLRQLVGQFERAHPRTHVTLLHIPENYFQKLHMLIAADLAPDVAFINSLSFPVYATHGVFLDLRPYMAQSRLARPTDYFPQSLAAFQWPKGDLSAPIGAIPRDVSDLVVFYNRDWLRAAKLADPKADWTWPEAVAMGRQAMATQPPGTKPGGPPRFGWSFYQKPPLFWLPFLWSWGGGLTSADLSREATSNPKTAAGLQFYTDLRHKYHVSPTQSQAGGTTMSQLFLQQRVAFLVSGRWTVPVLREEARFDWDVVPFPKGPAGSRVGIDASGYAITKTSKHPKEAWQLVEFLTSRPSVEAVSKSGLIVPARKDVAASPLFLAPGQKPANSRAFLDVIATGVPTATPARWNEFSETLMLAVEPVFDGEAKAAPALKRVVEELQTLLDTNPHARVAAGGKR
jgi:multiple sugar transport system substrate-binding protein